MRNGSRLFIDIDMDIDTEVNEEIRVLAYRRKPSQELDGTKKKVQMEFRTGDSSLNNNM